MNPILEQLHLGGIVPVVVLDDAANAENLAKALLAGGLATMEVTFRTDAAEESIARITRTIPEMLVGAGTVLTVEQVKRAVGAGARYIVSPGLNKRVVEYCLAQNIPVTPGVATPSEIEEALGLGLTCVKFFPAEANGGLGYLKAIAAPYKQVQFIPTGGIDESNLLAYLKFAPVLACGGSWMVKADLLVNKRFDEVTRLTVQAVHSMLGLKLSHVGINSADSTSAQENAAWLAQILRLPAKEGNSSTFVGVQFEILHKAGRGAHGHLAIGTNFIHRAIAYFKRQGVGVLEDSKVEKEGVLRSVYLDKEIAGFAIHLLQL